jgi:hypothetical protein
LVGDVTIDIGYNNKPKAIIVEAEYDSVSYSTGPIFNNDVIVFSKDKVGVTKGLVRVYVIVDSVVTLNVSCPGSNKLNVVQICVSNSARVGQYIHNDYTYTDLTYTSPTLASLVQIAPVTLTPMVSYYSVWTGNQGSSFIPTNGSTVLMRSNKIGFDDFQFDPAGDSFKYLRTNVNYQNTPGDIATLLGLASLATPINTINGPNLYSATFTMPNLPPSDDYLYLIWDYRSGTRDSLCYSNVSDQDACCDCTCGADCSSYVITVFADNAVNTYTNCNGTLITIPVTAGEVITICTDNTAPAPSFPTSVISLLNCGCTDDQPKPNSFSQLGNYYKGYTEPYQQYVSYTQPPVQDSVCQANLPIAATVYDFEQFYTETGFVNPIFGMQLYTDNVGTLSTYNGILIFTPTPDVLPTNISNAQIIYVINGVIASVEPALNYIGNC